MSVTASASPSLALIKYWGKLADGVNLPATPSLAITLDSLRTVTRVASSPNGATRDEITVAGALQPPDRFEAFIDRFRARAGSTRRVTVASESTFPTAAGLASSSSGFAALALGLDAFFGTGMTSHELSAVARTGSGSASRAVYGGFTVWRAGAEYAEPLAAPDHWPDLRVLVVVLSADTKPISSRAAMARTVETSPIYRRWCEASQGIFERGVEALLRRDIDELGAAMRESYLFMFSTMFTARPPVIYWLPESTALLHEAEHLRRDGIPVFETMDAGPQVKLVTTADYVEEVLRRVGAVAPRAGVIVSAAGGSPEVHDGR